MLFIGSLCIYVMAYGAASLFGGATAQLSKGLIKKTINKTADIMAEVSQEDYGLRPGEGLLETQYVFLFESCPILLTYQGGVLEKMARSRLELTAREIHELGALLAALNTFVALSDQEEISDDFIIVQIDMLIRPIVNFVADLPPLRVEAPLCH